MLFIEIGVSHGGSLQMWQRYFGPLATIVGIDIDPGCKKHEQPGIHVRIGSQDDVAFLKQVVNEFGSPDIVLDDGSHVMDHINTTFDFLYPFVSKNGCYMVEDLHTAYWKEYGGGIDNPLTFTNRAKGFIDNLNADHSRGVIPPDYITTNTFCMSVYDSIVAFDKGAIPLKFAPRIGTEPTPKNPSLLEAPRRLARFIRKNLKKCSKLLTRK